jgi:hypothetical protein
MPYLVVRSANNDLRAFHNVSLPDMSALAPITILPLRSLKPIQCMNDICIGNYESWHAGHRSAGIMLQLLHVIAGARTASCAPIMDGHMVRMNPQ